jgi:hypothetical protein
MELYVSGVAVPKLGSLQDRLARQYLARRADKEVAKNKVLAMAAVASGGPDNDKWAKEVSSVFGNYVNLELFLEGEVEKQERDMQREFEYWKTVKPTVVKGKDGSLSVKGIL